MKTAPRLLSRIRLWFRNRSEERKARRVRWEALCLRCGLCCYDWEIRKGKLIIHKESPCPYLDTATNLCTVYERRFRVNPDCGKMTLYRAKHSRRLPDSCGYVQFYRGKESGES